MDGKLRNMTSLYIQHEDLFLLLYRQGSRIVDRMWIATAGGHFEESELNDARICILRELKEELGISEDVLKNLEMRYITLRRTQGEIRQNYYFFAELQSMDINLVSNEGVLRWFSASQLQDLEMPYTAKYVVRHYLATGRFNHILYGGIADGKQLIFTQLPEF